MKIMNRSTVELLQSRIVTKPLFDYDKLSARPLYSLLSQYDIDNLRRIATSIRFAGNPEKRFKKIDEIMHSRGFIKMSAGTNRICYGYLEDPTICVKVAADRTGIKDNPREFMNQKNLKPFCTKVFEVSPCGTVGLFERVLPIQSREEFMSVSKEIFSMIDLFTDKYILSDFGTKYFMNYGVREGFGPVLLDFPYLYEADINKLVCHKPIHLANGITKMCGGLIDYDPGYNYLICKKCAANYRAIELAKYINEIAIEKGNCNMSELKIVLRKGNKVTKLFNDSMNQEATHVANKNTTKYGDAVILSAKRVVNNEVNTVKENDSIVNIAPKLNNDKKLEVVENKPIERIGSEVKSTKEDDNSLQNKLDSKLKIATINMQNMLNAAKNKEEKKSVNINSVLVTAKKESKEEKQLNEEIAKAAKVITEEIKNESTKEVDQLIDEIDKLVKESNKESDTSFVGGANNRVIRPNNDNVLSAEDIADALYGKDESWTQSSIDLENRVITYESDQNNKITLPLPEDYQDISEFESEIAQLNKDIEDLKAELQEALELANKSKGLEETVKQLNTALEDAVNVDNQKDAKIQELESTISDYKKAQEAVNEDDIQEEEEEYNGQFEMVHLAATATNVAKLTAYIPNLDVEDMNPEDTVIIFEDHENNTVYTDQFGNPMVITEFNGINIADKEIFLKNKFRKE